MLNVLYLPVIAIVMFGVGYLLVTIPGIRNRLKRNDKRFTDAEMQKLTDYRNTNFASTNEEYSHTPENLV